MEQVPTASVLMLLAFRPEFQPPWGNRAHLSHLALHRFTRKQTELVVEQVSGARRCRANCARRSA